MAVFSVSQSAKKRLLTTLRLTEAPSISLILTDFTCFPIASKAKDAENHKSYQMTEHVRTVKKGHAHARDDQNSVD